MKKLSIKPLDVVCPKCHAAKTRQCMKKVRDGNQFIDEFHEERLKLVADVQAGKKDINFVASIY